jgi:hypothetical protein
MCNLAILATGSDVMKISTNESDTVLIVCQLKDVNTCCSFEFKLYDLNLKLIC